MSVVVAVSDYNFGTLIRTDVTDEYTQFNTTFGKFILNQRMIWGQYSSLCTSYSVTRMQFYAYEIARNRRGLNDWVYEKAQEEAKKEVREKKERSRIDLLCSSLC